MKAEVIKLRQKLNELKNELNELKVTETYQTISEIVNWDEYFNETKEKLTKELFSLEN